MAHRWEIRRNKAGEFVAYFMRNDEVLWWTEGYSSKASAMNAIESVKRNASGAPSDDHADEFDAFRNAVVPASDRIVSPDHNAPDFKELDKAYRRFSERLNQSNDLREFTDDELEIARRETGEIAKEVRQASFRPAHLWSKAKSTLLWIAEKAVDGIIKALAVALLAALASFLGIPIPIL